MILTLVDDCSSYDSWVSKFKGIESAIGRRSPKPYEPLPGDGTFRLLPTPFGPVTIPHVPSANSNTWFMYLIREAGLSEPYDRAGRKIGGLPNAPGDTIRFPYQEGTN